MSEVILDDKNFETEVLKFEGPVLVDFYADWCGPCKMQGPIVDELAKEMEGKPVKIAKLNVDAAPEMSGKYEVMSIPTIIIFNKGAEAKRLVGLQSKDGLKSELENLLK